MSNTERKDRPPVFRSWRGWYLLLAGFTILQFIIYFVLTQRLNNPF